MNKFFKNHKYLITTLVIVLITLWILLIIEGDYGNTLFFAIPASIGFLIGYRQRYKNEYDERFKKIILGLIITMLVVAGLSGLLILIGIEGAICILMAYPFLVLPMFFAYLIGIAIGKSDSKNKMNSFYFILLLNPVTYIYDSYQTPIKDEVKTELIINKPVESIWKNLTTEIKFKKTNNFLFEKGITYPKSIYLNNNQGIKTYDCYTNNDTISLRIDELIIDKKVKFHLNRQTIPMKELSPYDEVKAEHLHNYFKVNYGEIILEPINKTKTKMIAITSYEYQIAPKWYWQLWSNQIINKMHLHVLESFK